jgi:hypothetical protein
MKLPIVQLSPFPCLHGQALPQRTAFTTVFEIPLPGFMFGAVLLLGSLKVSFISSDHPASSLLGRLTWYGHLGHCNPTVTKWRIVGRDDVGEMTSDIEQTMMTSLEVDCYDLTEIF